MSAEPHGSVPGSPASAASSTSVSPMPPRRRDQVELDGAAWHLQDGNVQGEFALVNTVGERRRLVGTLRAADLFGIAPDDVRRWVDAGRVRAVELDGVVLVEVQLSDTGHLTLLGA